MAPTWARMRIIALPLTSRSYSPGASSTLPLIYYHFQTPPPQGRDKGKQNLVQRAAGKAAETWAGFGKAPEGNWKRKLFVYGEKLVDRIDFEELSLKGVDPSLGPRIGQLLRKDKEDALVQIPLIYPPSSDFWNTASSSPPLHHMQSLLSKRTPHHKKGFYLWLGIAPLTAPFVLVPVVPNLPFFYAAWRSWSHYRAWKASEYLEGLINSNHVVLQPSPELDDVYASFRAPPDKHSTTDLEKPEPDPTVKSSHQPPSRLLLDCDAVPRIVELFDLSGSAGRDILRAIEQAKVRIERDASG